MPTENPGTVSQLTAIVIFCLTLPHFQNICSRHMHDLDLDLQNASRSNVNMTIECQYMTSCLSALVMFFVSVAIFKIFTVEICMALTLTVIIGQGQMCKCQSNANTVLHICSIIQTHHLSSKLIYNLDVLVLCNSQYRRSFAQVCLNGSAYIR